jgi:hypothetical protein
LPIWAELEVDPITHFKLSESPLFIYKILHFLWSVLEAFSDQGEYELPSLEVVIHGLNFGSPWFVR